MDWNQALDSIAGAYTSIRTAPAATPAAPVATGANGVQYQEGKPAAIGSASLLRNPLVWVGGVAVVGLVAYLALRKK